MSTVLADRLETLVIARAATASGPMSRAEMARVLRRFAPTNLTDADWVRLVDDCCSALQARNIVSARLELLDDHELERRIDKHAAKTWSQFADQVFPVIGLGVSADISKIASRLTGREAWTAAIAGRALGLWNDGAPPSLPAVCDAFAWHQLGLVGRPKRCPPEVRALFFQRELRTDAAPPDRLLRLFAARELEAPRPELRILRDCLVRNWLLGRTVGHTKIAPKREEFAAEVRTIASGARHGVFGDRKVFISSVWDDLRRRPSWSALTLADFKDRLVTAHRAGDLVLARADLVAAMNPDLVAASETVTDGASFHFIVREDAT
jgi:hypothetical protein